MISLRDLGWRCGLLAALSCSPPERPHEGAREPEDAMAEGAADGAQSSVAARRADAQTPREAPTDVGLRAPAGPPMELMVGEHPDDGIGRAEPPTVRARERRIASASARRGRTQFRFAVFDGTDPALDASGLGHPVPYRRSELSVRYGRRVRVLLESGPEALHDLLCRLPGTYRLEVIDELRPLLLLHAHWVWRACEEGMRRSAASYEEATFVIARDDDGHLRWTELRTRLALSSRRPATARDGTSEWVATPPIDERGSVRARADGRVIYTLEGERREIRLFGPGANAAWTGDALF